VDLWPVRGAAAVATGTAILRYRLYDLDRIISRTLAWTLLTLLLGLGYAAVALGLGGLLGRDSSLVVAAATLAVAAVFQPARRRIQVVVAAAAGATATGRRGRRGGGRRQRSLTAWSLPAATAAASSRWSWSLTSA
jgi:hypothetical protein